MKEKKTFFKFVLVLGIVLALVFIVLLITNIIFSYTDMYEWLSLYISFFALLISILSVIWNNIKQKENDYKKFVIEVLEKKRNSIIELLYDILSAMQKEIDFSESLFTDEILITPVFNNVFTKYYNKFSQIITNYKVLLKKNEKISHNKEKDLFEVLVQFKQQTIFFQEDINDLIKKIYLNEIKNFK